MNPFGRIFGASEAKTRISLLPFNIALSLTVVLAGAWTTQAALKTAGSGKKVRLVGAQFSDEQQGNFKVFNEKCAKCHSLARPIAALNTGRTPVSGGEFSDSYIKKYVVKMMRKPNSGITKVDAKKIILFLRHAKKQAKL